MRILEDYTPFHKTVVIGLWSFGFAALVRAIVFWGGGAFVVESQQVINAPAVDVWPWVTQTENRTRWIMFMRDFSENTGKLSTEVGTRRLVFFKRDGKRFHVREETTQVVPNRLFETYQEGSSYLANQSVELRPLGPCQTEVTFKDVIEPQAFSHRFWFFLDRSEEERRQENSLLDLKNWAEKGMDEVCDADAP